MDTWISRYKLEFSQETLFKRISTAMLLVKEIESIFLIVDAERLVLFIKLDIEFTERNASIILNNTSK